MVKLFCAIVGVAGNAFEVDIDADQKLGDLRKAITKKNKNKANKVDAGDLQLFLAKKGDAWLTEADVNEGVDDTTGLKPLEMSRPRLKTVGLSDEDVGEADEQEDAEGRDPAHVLAKLPDQGQQLGENDQDSLQMQRQPQVEITRLRARLELVKDALPHKNSKSYTDPVLGRRELNRLEKYGLVIDVAPDEDGTAFWSNEIQIEADAIGNEADLDAFITPYFSEVLRRCGMVFVNSERYQWLYRSPFARKSADLKPRGFATHPAIFRARPEPDDGVQRKDGFRFGVAEKELLDCAILFESKLTISDAAFGQVA